MRSNFSRVLFAFVFSIAAAAPVLAQVFPTKPIRIIVAFGPGGGNELYARVVGDKLRERLGQPVLVEIKPGANGNIAAEFVAKSPADGHTMLVAQSGLTMLPWMAKSLPFDVVKSFSPVGMGATVPMIAVVNNNLPVKSIADLIGYARANPGKISYAIPGIGSPHHMAVELLQNLSGTKMVAVPYKGAAAMLTDLMSGEVHFMIGAMNSAVPFFKADKIRAIGVAERQRVTGFPEIPAIAETLPGYEVTIWYGMMAPAGTPETIVNRLSEELRAIGHLPDVREALAKAGIESNPGPAPEMARTLSTEIEKWGKVIRAAGIQPQ